MRKVIVTLLLVISLFTLPSHAQWYKGATREARLQVRKLQQQASRKFHAQTKLLQQKIVRPVGVTHRQVERAVFEARRVEPSALTLKASKAIIPLRERHRMMRYFRVKGTAFAIEETYQGKRYVWGVTATHYGYQFPAIPKKRFVYENFSFRAQGNQHANDVSIFRIPESLANTFEPLKLAEQAPQPGDRLISLSFFDNQFQYTPGRKVLETSPLRFTTSLKIEPGMDREGECGSPLLNHNGEVVGMVVGASYRREIGFAVPVENIRQIIQAYHEREASVSPIFANGKQLFELDVTEAIARVRVKNVDGSVIERSTYHQEKELDYAHLENFIDLSKAKEISFTIEQTPFTTTGEKVPPTVLDITYDVQTQQTTKMVISAP